MPTPIRDQIIQAIAARVVSLSTLPIGRAVRADINEGQRFISLWDKDDTAVGKQYGKQKLEFSIGIEMIFDPGETNASIAGNAAIAEIVALMYPRDPVTDELIDTTFGGLIDKMDYVGAVPEYPGVGGTNVVVTVTLNITYQTRLGDPYNQ